MTIKAIVHPAAEGGFWAEVPALPGCFTEGETLDEVRENLKEAIEGWLGASQDFAQIGAQDQVMELAL